MDVIFCEFTGRDFRAGRQNRKNDGAQTGDYQDNGRECNHGIIRYFANPDGYEDGQHYGVDGNQDIGLVVSDGAQVDLIPGRKAEHGFHASAG